MASIEISSIMLCILTSCIRCNDVAIIQELYVLFALHWQAFNRNTLEKLEKQPLFLCHRPAWAEGYGASLIHPEFSIFMEGCRDPTLPTRRDAAFAADFCFEALKAFPDEEHRQLKLVWSTGLHGFNCSMFIYYFLSLSLGGYA